MSVKGTVKGTVKWFDRKKGYGFITPNDGGDDVFVHHSGIEASVQQNRYLCDNEPVAYDIDTSDDPRGRPRAVNVGAHDLDPGARLQCCAPDAARPRAGGRRRRPRPGCPAEAASCGWSVAKDADRIEDKIFRDAHGGLWRMVAHNPATESADASASGEENAVGSD